MFYQGKVGGFVQRFNICVQNEVVEITYQHQEYLQVSQIRLHHVPSASRRNGA